MKKIISIILVVMMAFNLFACSTTNQVANTAQESKVETEVAKENTEAKPADEFKSNILFCGSTSLYPILSSLASSFTEEYVTWDKVDPSFPDKHISIYVAPGGSGVGVTAAVDGTADFGMLARDIKDKEIEKLGPNYKQFVVAKDALTVSVNMENPIVDKIDDMESEMIKQIFSGEIDTWDKVDSSLPAEKINVYIRDLSGGAYEVFQNVIMKDSQVTADATQSASMTELAKNISNDKWAIGYAGFGAYNKINADKQVIKAMKVDGIDANAENVVNGSYKIQRPVMFVSGSPITNSEQKFIDYIFSDKGKQVVEANGYIPAF